MIYLGIDNGLNGGIVALSPHGIIINKWVMPTKRVFQPARKNTKERILNEVDASKFLEIINSLGDRSKLRVTFEHCPFHADRASSMRSMAMSAGKLFGVMETRGIEVERILNFDWHPVMLGKVPQGKTKLVAREKAWARWPGESWLPTKRHRVPHDGMIDAALIAEFRRTRDEQKEVAS